MEQLEEIYSDIDTLSRRLKSLEQWRKEWVTVIETEEEPVVIHGEALRQTTNPEPVEPVESVLDSEKAERLFKAVEDDLLISQGSKDYISYLQDQIKSLEAK